MDVTELKTTEKAEEAACSAPGELNDDNLDLVSGGMSSYETLTKYLPDGTYGRQIGKYEAEQYIGKVVYAVLDKNIKKTWFVWGTLLNTYEKDNGCNSTRRTQTIQIIGKNGDIHNGDGIFPQIGVPCDFSGDTWILFECTRLP